MKNKMTAAPRALTLTKITYVVLIALACFLLVQESSTTYAAKKPNFGRIEISTNPGGFPLLVDEKPTGATTNTVQQIDLPPGDHTIKILFPNDQIWKQDFHVLAGRRYCIALNHVPKRLVITKSPCPYPVNVSAPASVNEGDTITFTADVTYGGPSALNYTWTVSPATARIVSGSGTPTITVETGGVGSERVTAILVVDDSSGERACRQTAQASTGIIQPVIPTVSRRKFDEFPSVAFDDDKARLDNLAIELQNTPNAQAYVIVYGGRTSRPGQAQNLAERSKNYLVGTRGIDASRLVLINGGYRDVDTIEMWIVPQGAEPPQPSPTVQPGDVHPQLQVIPRRSRRRRG